MVVDITLLYSQIPTNIADWLTRERPVVRVPLGHFGVKTFP